MCELRIRRQPRERCLLRPVWGIDRSCSETDKGRKRLGLGTGRGRHDSSGLCRSVADWGTARPRSAALLDCDARNCDADECFARQRIGRDPGANDPDRERHPSADGDRHGNRYGDPATAAVCYIYADPNCNSHSDTHRHSATQRNAVAFALADANGALRAGAGAPRGGGVGSRQARLPTAGCRGHVGRLRAFRRGLHALAA
jgi:hypothetical protein